MKMAKIKVGIMPSGEFRQYTLDIATGKHVPKRGEPKVWFASMKALSETLSDPNRELLRLIAEQSPDSLSELAELSGRAVSSISRTLKNMENAGLVQLKRGKHGRVVPKVPYSDITLDMSIGRDALGA
jgi:predicted transcriptional regulator